MRRRRARRQRADAEDARRPPGSTCATARASGRRGAGDRRLPQVPRDLAARAAARRGDAPDRRPRDGPGRQQERAGATPDYKAAIARYNDFLKAYPNDPGNDRVLYQLARAYEQGGDLGTALKTLDRLVKDYPLNRFRDEAQFRRGELLFTAKDYPNAEKAFATVLAGGPTDPYHDRSLYMQGWSQFKQTRLEDGLRSFFAVLDLKIAGKKGEGIDRPRRPEPRRPRARRGHLPRHQHQPRQPEGRREHPRVHRRLGGAATSSASTSSSASSTSARSAPRTRPTPSACSRGRRRCMRRRRCCRRG